MQCQKNRSVYCTLLCCTGEHDTSLLYSSFIVDGQQNRDTISKQADESLNFYLSHQTLEVISSPPSIRDTASR